MIAEDVSAAARAEAPVVGSRLWPLTLLAALSAGLGAWLAGESGALRIRPAEVRVQVVGGEMVGSTPRSRTRAVLQSDSAALGVFGGLLGAGLGLAGGRSRRPGRWTWRAAAVGLLVGGLAGAGPPWVVIPLASRNEDLGGSDLGRSIVVHGALWIASGATAGLALGLGACGRSRRLAVDAAIGGALGAAAGVVIYDLVGGLAFPLSGSGRPIATTPAARLLAFLLVALGAAAGASALVSSGRRDRPVGGGA
ncbi:hypothetical protein [Paludisphaera soli]|uniref:hypothetical protein n=1 Tax=Paludisphaera soli TaxID=2712865 RepID=UPI0013EB759D|nr:hypothetical protein [Paludisphaera soli]